jgi:hypothetical protein
LVYDRCLRWADVHLTAQLHLSSRGALDLRTSRFRIETAGSGFDGNILQKIRN